MSQFAIDYTKRETDKGIKKAVDHANTVHDGWMDEAYQFLKNFIQSHSSFMTEDVRYAAQGIVRQPPHLRAWAGPIKKAVKDGLIKHARFQKVKTISSHGATASVWHRI